LRSFSLFIVWLCNNIVAKAACKMLDNLSQRRIFDIKLHNNNLGRKPRLPGPKKNKKATFGRKNFQEVSNAQK